MHKKAHGFTIVELLIVVIVIGILAAISVVAYSSMGRHARDSRRKQDIAVLQKALELYYVEHGQYPSTSTVTSPCEPVINGFASTVDSRDTGCWAVFMDHLKPFLDGQTINEPTPGPDWNTTPNYSVTTYYCSRQTYVIYYVSEVPRSNPVVDGSKGGCGVLAHAAVTSTRHVIVRSKL